VRIKDLVEIRGVRSNPLVGLGLVVGLPGSGDSRQSLTTNKQVSNLLTRLGSKSGLQDVTTKNVAAVVVSAELPAFARVGDRLDIRISSIGDATSLEGGTLILTPLAAADTQVYAVAQGSVSMGTAMAGAAGGGGGGGSGAGQAPKTVGLARSATVEREFASAFVSAGVLELSLRNADFTTASRIGKVINETFGAFLADPVNAGLVKVKLPPTTYGNPSFTPVAFVAQLEQLRVEPDTRALVVVNERTGTIIAGGGVAISPVAISHGQLEILVESRPLRTSRVTELPRAATVGELVKALGALGAGPKDLVSILQTLEAAKALKADLKIL
jgi:flagellar P-ring protein precursor FlgI